MSTDIPTFNLKYLQIPTAEHACMQDSFRRLTKHTKKLLNVLINLVQKFNAICIIKLACPYNF